MTDNQDKKNAPEAATSSGQSVKNNLTGHPHSSDNLQYNNLEGGGQDPKHTELQTEALRRVQELAVQNPDNPFMAQAARDIAAKWLHNEPQNNGAYKTTWSAADLLAAEFPELKWALPGIIPAGLTILAGRPKIGKSWLALQIAGAFGTGGRALGETVKRGKVLYLALEDSARRLKNRLEKQHTPSNADITFKLEWRLLAAGGINDLEKTIQENGYSLVVIDTLARLYGRAKQDDQGDMTALMGDLHHLATTLDICILAVEHHRKTNGFDDNPVDDILGATAKSAVVDAILGLYRERGKRGSVLKVTGRDLEERELSLEFDVLTGCWQCLGDANEVRESSSKKEVLRAIQEIKDSGELATCSRIAKHLNKDVGNINRVISDLVNAGKLKPLDGHGRAKPYDIQ